METVRYTPPAASEVLRFQVHQEMHRLFNTQLMMLEDLSAAHNEALSKLCEALPDEYRVYIDLADYLTDERYQQLRKRILDNGNDCRRAIEKHISNFDIDMKETQ